MSRVLTYPTYSLPKLELRGLLLFYDEISAIVPQIDRGGVEKRPQVYEIKEIDADAIKFEDPEPHLNWYEPAGIEQILRNMALENNAVDQEVDDFLRSANLNIANYQRANLEKEQADRFFRKGWMLVAEQRIHPDLMSLLIERRLAVPIASWPYPDTNQIATYQPLLVNGTVAKFVLARLAREISDHKKIPTLSLLDSDISNHAFDGELAKRETRSALLGTIFDLIVPDDIEKLTASEFMAIRSDYSDIRRNLNVFLRDFAVNNEFDDLDRLRDFVNNTSRIKSVFEEEMDLAKNRLGSHRFSQNRKYGISALASIAGAAIGGVGGAVAGSSISWLGYKYDNRFSTRSFLDQSTEGLVMLRGSIKKRLQSSTFEVPSYIPKYL
ncbi:hypothetical protein [Ruegeria sp. Ofav3-42]|uniref:hypothetical protein n=1 Tax=Ruegeria sp. Ofav3-42 TaxID=2917759 RepID=UPI001EF41FC8|nr:hypothetical protein [Ruegeria sp. Ofav3-42]MCG7519528.1 hypothetical protein [Ruegeria sp. Ofav3-42]